MRFFHLSALACLAMAPASAVTAAPIAIDWFGLQAGAFTTGATSISRTLDGLTVTARGYRATVDPTGADAVSGPLSGVDVAACATLNPVSCPGGRDAGLRLSVAGLGIRASGDLTGDTAIGLNGFAADGANSLEFVVFGFSAPVDVGSVIVDDVSNFGRSIWYAGGVVEPDFGAGLASGLAPFTVSNSPDDATDGLFAHAVNLSAISFLIVGAPFPDGGPSIAGIGRESQVNFYIRALGDVALRDGGGDDDTVAPIPLPASGFLAMAGAGLLALVGRRGRRRAA